MGKLAGSEFMRKLCRAFLIPSHKPSYFMATGHLSQRLFEPRFAGLESNAMHHCFLLSAAGNLSPRSCWPRLAGNLSPIIGESTDRWWPHHDCSAIDDFVRAQVRWPPLL